MMGVAFIYKTGKQSNKGFTEVELLIVLCVFTVLSLLVISKPFRVPKKINPDVMLQKQAHAMAHHKRLDVFEGVWFNPNGNVNRARTFKVGKQTCTIQLGFGRYLCE